MTTRAEFLARISARLAGGVSSNPLRPIPDVGPGVPTIDYTVDLDDLPAAFTAAATTAGAEVHALEKAGTLHQLLEALAGEGGVATAVVSADPECAPVADVLREVGIEQLAADDVANAARADLGITGARAGIALTGSLVVDSSRSGTRLASILPPTHLALLERDRILATPGDLLRGLDAHLPEGLPSNLVLITGHSRSADIELRMTPGVHGPRRVLVGLR